MSWLAAKSVMAPNSCAAPQNAPPVRWSAFPASSVYPEKGSGSWSVATMMPG